MMKNCASRLALTLGLAGLCSVARAGPAQQVRLEWQPGAANCPDRATLESAIAARLGYSPFKTDAVATVVAKVVAAGTGLSATVESFDGRGTRTGRRTFDSPTQDCSELAASIELAITIAVDPQAALGAPASLPAQPPQVAPAEPMHFSVGVWAAGELGLGPSATGAAALQLALSYRAFEVALEGWADVPSSTEVSEADTRIGTVSANVLAGSLLACGVYRWFGACAVGSVGAMRVTGELSGLATRQTAVLPLAGARLRGNIALGPVRLQPFVEVDFVLNRVTVRTPTATIWVTPPVSGKLGLAAAFQLF